MSRDRGGVSDLPTENEASFLKSIGNRSEHETQEAERELRKVLELEPTRREARELLLGLYLATERYLDIGRVLGRETLESVRTQAERKRDRRQQQREHQA